MHEKRKHPDIPVPTQGFGVVQQIIEQLRLTWALLLDNRVSLLLKLIPIIGIAYLLSPIDLVLLFIPPLGLLVDLAVVLMAVAAFNLLAPADVVAEHLTRMRTRRTFRVSRDDKGTVIDIKMPEQNSEDQQEAEIPPRKRKVSGR